MENCNIITKILLQIPNTYMQGFCSKQNDTRPKILISSRACAIPGALIKIRIVEYIVTR